MSMLYVDYDHECDVDEKDIFGTCFITCNNDNQMACEECLNDHLLSDVDGTTSKRASRRRWCSVCEVYRKIINRFYMRCYLRNDASRTIECVVKLIISKPLLCIDCVPSSICYFNPKSNECSILKNRQSFTRALADRFVANLNNLKSESGEL